MIRKLNRKLNTAVSIEYRQNCNPIILQLISSYKHLLSSLRIACSPSIGSYEDTDDTVTDFFLLVDSIKCFRRKCKEYIRIDLGQV